MESLQGKKKGCIQEIGVASCIFFSKNSKPTMLFVFVVLCFIPSVVYADDDKSSNTTVTLGWISIGCGLVANLSLVVFKIVRKIPVLKLIGGMEMAQNMTQMYKPLLNFHIMLNSIGFFAGLSHGLLLIRGLDAISLSLVIVMAVSMISGMILKYASDKDLKVFGRLIHGQFILSILLVTLVILHVLTHNG